jgi:hypothetical protein
VNSPSSPPGASDEGSNAAPEVDAAQVSNDVQIGAGAAAGQGDAAAAVKTKAEAKAAAEKKAEEEAAAAKKKNADEAAAAKKKAEEEVAANRKAEEEAAAKKKAEEEAAAKKAADEVAAEKKAEEAAAATKKAEEAAAAAAAAAAPGAGKGEAGGGVAERGGEARKRDGRELDKSTATGTAASGDRWSHLACLPAPKFYDALIDPRYGDMRPDLAAKVRDMDSLQFTLLTEVKLTNSYGCTPLEARYIMLKVGKVDKAMSQLMPLKIRKGRAGENAEYDKVPGKPNIFVSRPKRAKTEHYKVKVDWNGSKYLRS